MKILKLSVVALFAVACLGETEPTDTTTDSGTEESRTDVVVALTGDAATGQGVYDANCAVCHGITATGGTSGPDLTPVAAEGADVIIEIAINGSGGSMPSFSDLPDQELADVTAFIIDLVGP